MALSGAASEPVYPLKVSRNHRYFVDRKGEPVFWLGTTQWELCRSYTIEEARLIIEKTKGHGFAFAQVMVAGVGEGTNANVHGEKPWNNDDCLQPNENYFKHVDAVVGLAREHNLILSLSVYHQRWRKIITTDKARAWGKWIGKRYKGAPAIVWSMIPEATPEFIPVVRELAAGLRTGDQGTHLITVEPDPAPHPAEFLHNESWLDACVLQTWKWVEQIHPMIASEYRRKPIKPIVMGEGAYEHGTEYGFEVTPLWVRRQAYYTYLAGAHHGYGHNDSWRVLPTWKQALDASGAIQLGLLKKVFEERKEWWLLVPDQTVFASGGRTNGQVLNLAARHKDGQWLMAYLGEMASVALDLRKLARARRARAFWVDPRDGKVEEAGEFSANITQCFTTPVGWEDALLIVEPWQGRR